MRAISLAFVAVAVVAACGDPVEPPASDEPSPNNIRAATPIGWVGQGTDSPDYTIGLDTVSRHGGRAAFVVYGKSAGFTTAIRGIGQIVSADAYRGKRLRFSAWVRSVSTVGPQIGLWMRIDGPNRSLSFDGMTTRSVLGTTGWHQVEIRLDVPDDAVGIHFGALMQGAGLLLVDDMKWEVVPATGPTTEQVGPGGNAGVDFAAIYAGRPTEPVNMDFEAR